MRFDFIEQLIAKGELLTKYEVKKVAISLALVVLVFLSYFVTQKTELFQQKNDNLASAALISTKQAEIIKLLFVGDMMFDRHIRQASLREDAFIFGKIQNMLKENDLVIGNLEGPITESGSVSLNSVIGSSKNMVFTFDPKVATLLEKENIKLVNIGNNHITNFGSKGVISTRKYLAQSNIGFFGDPENQDYRVSMQTIKGWKIVFVNYNQFVTDGEKKALEDIVTAKNLKPDFIILYTHWGSEYVNEPNEKIKTLAHNFIDAGVDLIIGTHPHVIETKEAYKGKQIYYSLGNFVFDQYFDPRTQKGMIVQVQIDANKQIKFEDFFVQMEKNGQTSIAQ